MTGVPISPRRIFGVDFSGAENAGRHIWVCRAHPGAGGIRIESVDPLCDLPGGARDRQAALRSLVVKVLDAPRSAWGFDFPFGLPLAVLEALHLDRSSGWVRHLEAISGLGSPEALREACRRAAGGKERRRVTDLESSTPFCPYNLRMYKQTFYGMTEVLLSLHGRPGVAVLPMDPLPDARVEAGKPAPVAGARPPAALPHIYLLEVCPASLLRARGYTQRLAHYKGNSDDNRRRRRGILERLVSESLVRPVPRALRQRLADDPRGDAVDSVVAAVGAWLGVREEDHATLRAGYGVEGYVYGGGGR